MKKCFIFSIIFLLSVFFVLLVYINIKEKFKFKSFKKTNRINKNLLYNRILNSNNSEEIDKREFLKKKYNISIYTIDEVQKCLNSTLDNYKSNIANENNKNHLKNYSLLIRKNYFLLDLIENTFFGNLYSNNSLDEIELYDSFEEFVKQNLSNFNYSNSTDLNINFYKGKNLTTNIDLLIFKIKNLKNGKNIHLFSYLDDIYIETDTYNNLLKVKILNAKLNNEEINDNDNCTASIKMLFKYQYKSFQIKKGNYSEYLTIYSIDNYDNYLICISNCLQSNILIKFKKEYKDLFVDFFVNLLINLFGDKTKHNLPNVSDTGKKLGLFLNLSAIINSIYYLYFAINIYYNKISIHSFSYEILFGIMYFYNSLYFGVEIILLLHSFHEKTSWIFRLEFFSGILFSIIYFFVMCYFLGVCFEMDWKEMKAKKRTVFCVSLMTTVIAANIVLFFSEFQVYLFLFPCIMLGYQIIKNIIFDNKYIYPLFYCIFFSIDKLIFSQSIGMDYSINIIPETLVICLIEIIILYLQGFFGPRIIFGSKCKAKNNTIYRTKYELLSEKPNSKDDFCSICLLPFFNSKNSEINNATNNNKNNNTEANIIKETIMDNINNNFSKENSENNNNKNNNNCSNNNSNNNNNNNQKNNNNCININIIFDDLELGKKNNIDLIAKNKNKNCRCKKFFKILVKIIKFFFWDFYFNKTKFLGKYSLLPCGHIFHSECINAWINNEKKCPICRQEIKPI